MALTVRPWDDPTSWNAFVSSTPSAHFQQSWEWGELAPLFGSRSIRLGAVENGQLKAAMHVFVNPLGRTGLTHLAVPRGPALFQDSLRYLPPLVELARIVGREQKAVGIKIEPNVENCHQQWKVALEEAGLHPTHPPTQPRSSWVLDISPDSDALLEAMKQKTRYNIRLAARKGVDVSSGTLSDLDAFYEIYVQTAARDDFFILSKVAYARMFKVFEGAGAFCMLLAKYQGKLLAVATLLRFGATCWYMHGASSNEHRNLMAPYLLQWEGIQWAKNHGCTLYDFRAVPDVLRENQDMYGVYRFKEGFGGCQFTTLPTYATGYQPVLFSLWQLYFSGRFAANAWMRRRKGLPARQFA